MEMGGGVAESIQPIENGLYKLTYHKRSLTEFVIEEFWILKQGRISNKRCC